MMMMTLHCTYNDAFLMAGEEDINALEKSKSILYNKKRNNVEPIQIFSFNAKQ